MDVDESKIGEWPNVALVPGTHTHAATGEHVEQPEDTRIGRSRGADGPVSAEPEQVPEEDGSEPEIGEIIWHSEVIDGHHPSDCPYCGCERVVVGEYEPCHDEPWDYRIEHKDTKEAIGRKCFAMYVAYKTPEDAVRGADMRAPEWAIPINENTMRVLSGVCRKQSKRQLRAEAVERLCNCYYTSDSDLMRAILSWGHEPHTGDDARFALIDLLTDEYLPEGDAVAILRKAATSTSANTSVGDVLRYNVPGNGGSAWQTEEEACEALADMVERDLSAACLPLQAVDKQAEQVDSREKIEVDAFKLAHVIWQRGFDWGANHTDSLNTPMWSMADIFELLDRQDAITRRDVLCNPDERDEQIAELQAKVDELTAERDELKAEIAKYEHDCGLLFDEKHSLTADVKRWADAANAQRLVAMEQADKVQELTAERDHLKDVVKVQANSFAKLGQELAEAKSKMKMLEDENAALHMQVHGAPF